MKLAEPEKDRIIVSVKSAHRDMQETIDEIDEKTGKPTGKKIKNKMFGKMVYETIGSFEVFEATGEQVEEACKHGILHPPAKR